MGSEPGMGWNWIVNLARHCELFVISEGEFREQCEEWCKNHPAVGHYIHWFWNPVLQSTRDKCWNQGDWSFYPLYKKWQRKTADIAREICKNEDIDILHQLNMIGFREPGFLWQVSRETGVPFIWGPINAKESFPTSYLQGAPLKSRLFIYLKNFISKHQLSSDRRVHASAKVASFVIAASGDSAKSIKKYLNVSPILINESGSNPEEIVIHPKCENAIFNLLWVGRFIFTKQLTLALRTLSEASNNNIRLHIVGGALEEEEYFKLEAQKLGIKNQCIWYEKVSHQKVQKLMQQSDILFFTSIAEGTPHVVLEALNNRLPVLCFDTCGQGDCVTNEVGIKIPLTNPKESVKEFALKLNFLFNNRDVLKMMSKRCGERIKQLTWDKKALQILELYKLAASKSIE
ncbi:MAG: glycosyltransferase [Parasporobacterium sp.]|nr:glycosyltransferase [Parasporobacterium sp.]